MSDLPAGWHSRPLGELVHILDHLRVPVSAKERAQRVGDVPYYGAAGRVGFIDRPLFNEPLIALGEDGVQFFDRDKAKAYLIDGPAWVNNHAHVLRPIAEVIERRFLLHYLNFVNYRGLANGTTRLKLTQAAMRRIPVGIPGAAEQRSIVAILEDHLSRLDAAASYIRAGRRRAARLNEGLLAGEYATASGGPVALLPPVAGVDDSTLPELSADWSWRRLGDIADVVGGVTKDAKRQGDSAFVDVPYLRVANVQRGHLDLALVKTLRVPPARAAALRLLHGDVLLNEGGDRDKLGRGWLWESQIEHCIHQNHVFRARVRADVLLPDLLSEAANTVGGQWCQRNGTQSVNLASISLRKIRLMPVPVPPRDEQGAIAARVAERRVATSRLDDALTAAEGRLAALRRALLAAAFSGRLTGRTSDLDHAEEQADTEILA